MASLVLLLAALVLAPIIGGGFGELTNGILQILVFGGIIAYLVSSRPDYRRLPRVPGFVPLAAFLLICCVSAIFTQSIYPSIRQLLFLFACICGYLLAAAIGRDKKNAAYTIWAAMLTALGICLVAIRDYAIATGGGSAFWKSLTGSGEHARLFGTFINPGFFAGYLVIAIPITLGVYLITRRRTLALLAGIALALEVISLMLTATKFAIIASIISMLAFVVLPAIPKLQSCFGRVQPKPGPKLPQNIRFKRLLVMAVALIPLLIIFSRPMASRINEAEAGGSQVHSTAFRIYTWQATVNMIKDNPWLGTGPGTFEVAYPRYSIAGPTVHAHQSYLQIASDSGIFAIAAFLFTVLSTGYCSIKGIIKGSKENVAPDEPTSSPSEITWSDLIPPCGWRVMNCAIVAALTGSMVRNLADSDWFVIGIALPFCILAGVLAAQSDTQKKTCSINQLTKYGTISALIVMILASLSFGLGDFIAPDEVKPTESYSDILQGYRQASTISPLNPLYHREAAKYLSAEGNWEEAIREIKIAIRLAPTDADNYYVRAMLASAMNDPSTAIAYYERTLRYEPNSTQALYQLALANLAVGNVKNCDAAFKRLLKIENSKYEQIKGVPEIVDTTFARAHAYFGKKYLKEKKYKQAAAEFKAAIIRLENWRSHKQALEVMRYTGRLSNQEEKDLLQLLRDLKIKLRQKM